MILSVVGAPEQKRNEIGAGFPVYPRLSIHRLGPKKNRRPENNIHALLNAHPWHILGEYVDMRLDVPTVGI